jgi:porphobilinogen synthase
MPTMSFPIHRLRRLRQSPAMRSLVRESRLSVEQLVMPLFVCEGTGVKRAIDSMPGQYQMSVDHLLRCAGALVDDGVPAVILFGIPSRKDPRGSGAYARNGIIARAVLALKKAYPSLIVIADVCLCEYTSHGHCGLIAQRSGAGTVENDPTLKLLGKCAVAYADAGVDMVAPSDMMDGRVAAIRSALDDAGHIDTSIMSYAAKFASAFYGPFRDAAGSTPQFGDRKTYQMDYANGDEAMREVELDVVEGADIVMVKPGLAYLDLIWRVKDRFRCPVAAYNVSGEYAMVKAAAGNGWIDERGAVMEILTGMRRAGADILLTYWAHDVARWLKTG